MSSLRGVLKRPEFYLAVLAVGFLAAVADMLREPEDQLGARVYATAIDSYQEAISPLLRSHIRCRYEPSCSEYSKRAVERFGVLRGLALSYDRLRSCQPDVPTGTPDPVPGGP